MCTIFRSILNEHISPSNLRGLCVTAKNRETENNHNDNSVPINLSRYILNIKKNTIEVL